MHVPNNRSLDVIVYYQHCLWCVLGEQQQPAERYDSQNNESHKQQFTSGLNSANGGFESMAIAKKRLAIFRQPFG
jgi:hypothetical protein